jgi:hypothetical protein
MPRNLKLELNNVGPGRWLTSDGRFGVFKRMMPINPWLVTYNWKIKFEYSIHDFRDYNGPREYIELAPEVGRVGVYREVFPWLGKFTGEGSFEFGNPDRVTAKNGKVEEVAWRVFGKEKMFVESKSKDKDSILKVVFG